LRVRFFLIILGIFLFTVAILGGAQSYISHAERLRLVDQQIEQMASALYSSELSDARIKDIEESSDIIADVLSDERLNALISIYDSGGRVIYQNKEASLSGATLTIKSGKQQIEKNGHILRLLSVPFSDQSRILQVGLLLDSNLMRWHLLSLRMITYVGFTLLLVAGASYFLSYLLLRPIDHLAQYLQHRVTHFDEKWGNPVLTPKPGMKDEVWRLTQTIESLLAKVHENIAFSQSRAALVAHELKTPLTILKNNLETLQNKYPIDSGRYVTPAIEEVDHLGTIVNEFTRWSLFESRPADDDEVYAVKLVQISEQIVQKLQVIYPNRIKLFLGTGATIFANRTHIEHAIMNLMVNALQYSPVNCFVEVEVKAATLIIRDYGSGIPAVVVSRLGSPFNIGYQEGRPRGTGLGLAWVCAIARKYRWSFRIENLDIGSRAQLQMEPSV
jgi:signal transduction histidine kinase